MDLSSFSDEQLALILLRVPAKELIKVCTQVSKQWNRVLAQNYYWRNKMEYDRYRLEWPKLVGLSTNSFKAIAVHHSFGRNFIRDSWDLSVRDEGCLKFDERWSRSEVCWPQETNRRGGHKARIEIPPNFKTGQPEVGTEIGEPIGQCLATSFRPFKKSFVIKFADEGLTDEIMDNFRPTIVISEFVANRHDCASRYQIKCSLKVTQIWPLYYDFYPANENGLVHEERSDDEISAIVKLRFNQWEAERWVKVEHIFKDYPPGMRLLEIQCIGCDSQYWRGYYGVKLANCSVKALCEKNAPE